MTDGRFDFNIPTFWGIKQFIYRCSPSFRVMNIKSRIVQGFRWSNLVDISILVLQLGKRFSICLYETYLFVLYTYAYKQNRARKGGNATRIRNVYRLLVPLY